jgi:cell division septum initiation protein DivIVA
MAGEPERTAPAGALTALPRVEDLPVAQQGFDQDKVREAFDAFRRHTLQLQAQLRVLQAAGGTAQVEPTGHAVRMDALHLIRAAAEFADQLERDAQNASAAQIRRTQEEVERKQHEVQAREQEVEGFRKESEKQRAEILNAARSEARDVVAKANQDATRELQEAEASGARLLEQARHQATELTNAARAEVEQTLEWARAQAGAVMARAQQGAEQLLSAAGLGSEQLADVVDAIMRSTEGDGGSRSRTHEEKLEVEAAEEDVDAAPVADEEPGETETDDESPAPAER